MNVPITKKMLIDWGGADVVRDAEILVDKGMVLESEYEAPYVRGAILWNNRELRTGFKILSATTIESECPCYTNRERGLICPHVIALGIMLVRRATDPERERHYQQELRRASRLAQVSETDYIQRVAADTPGAVPARLVFTLGRNWVDGFSRGEVTLIAEAEANGQRLRLDAVPRQIPLTFSKHDESLLYVIEDISEGPALGEISIGRADLLNILRLSGGRELLQEDGGPVTVNEARMTTSIRVDLDGDTGELNLTAHTPLPFLAAGESPVYLVEGRSGWVYGAGNIWPLENLLAGPYHAIYQQPIRIARPDVLRFIGREMPMLAKQARLDSDLSLDLFTVEPATPRFRLTVRGSPASLSALLTAEYGDVCLVAGKPDAQGHFALPDPDDLMRYLVRNDRAEKNALDILSAAGFVGACGDDLAAIVDRRNVLNFLGSKLPALRRLGWKVDMEGRVAPLMDDMEFATPVVHIEGSGENWFDVGFAFEDARGASLSPAEIQQAIRKGDSYIERGGRTVLIDSDAIESMLGVFSDCSSGEAAEAGHFRMSNVYAAFVKSSLDALDGVDVEDTPDWRTCAAQTNRTATLERMDLGPRLNGILRTYQRDGVDWLRFLESSGFCGLLADEMGLGKTIETLAWLAMPRVNADLQSLPALIVCPTSLVENWVEEAARFVPELKVMALTGAERHERWDDVRDANVVVTSYALLRRDLENYLEHEFAVAVLDEAQHIKNRSTQNAQAAKRLKAAHRLVLTGTPVENGVSDLWSIMDFLMPGYLGGHDVFRRVYEQPIFRGGAEGDAAQIKLRRKLQPFLLRRLKKDVARDLPPKIEKISTCDLTPDQKMVYRELLESSRRRVNELVSRQGFNRCRMEILTTLMRLRQACCHLDLLKLPGLKAAQPSAKMDLFFELVDEAIDAGHRILVFSQFVSMLTILRQEMDARGIEYCYLDGQTQNRMDEVHRFNAQREIPVFLISLKAGGTGLNLTGADMVIHFDPWWNPAVENQATDRAYRIGQNRTVYSLKLITRSSIEEKVLALQRRKKDIIDATIESDEDMVRSLSWEDVQELLEL